MRVVMFISGSLLGFFCVCNFFFLFCHTGSMWEILGQGLNLHCTVATRATAVRTQEPQPTRPSENSLNLLSDALLTWGTAVPALLFRVCLTSLLRI